MEVQIFANEIKNMTIKLQEIEKVLKKPLKEWSESDKLQYVNHEKLRVEKNNLINVITLLLEQPQPMSDTGSEIVNKNTNLSLKPKEIFDASIFEGLPDTGCIDRSAKVDLLIRTVQQTGPVLISAPKFSGKTALCQLVYNELKRRNFPFYAISFNEFVNSATNEKDKFHDLKEFFKSKGIDFDHIIRSTCILLTDETQNVFGIEKFWLALKATPNSRHRVGLISFSAYDAPRVLGTVKAPICFQVKLGITFLHFDQEEERQVYGIFREMYPNLYSVELFTLLHDITQGHPGLFHRSLLEICLNFYKDGIRTANDVYRNIISGRLNKPLRGLRCFIPIHDLQPKCDKDDTPAITHQQLQSSFEKLLYERWLPSNDPGFAYLCYQGVVAKVNADGGQMSCKLIEDYYRFEYCCVYLAPTKDVVLESGSPELVLAIIANLNNTKLFGSHSVGVDGLKLESAYQTAIMFSLYQLMKPTRTIVINVGQAYHAGFLDIYVNNNLNFGFELLRNGERLNKHLERFDKQSGKYSKIPLKYYAVLDFYDNDQPTKSDDVIIDRHYFKVIFGPEFKYAKVKSVHGEATVDLK
ncbi:hypothetical protein ROZALSC1DRAFT_26707 [Rozella allomycis CSF55]|uniref:Uncharacterized protein n=1 Tax=Rozella allomycis (strain CSF55) TaxID=988480 RepID=A0A075AMS8_ROZAC|nr:hypothetical protein O9G_001459 [Rozella allomycis CSF55]RKP21912.1 hypothetical protein ROZALSC1DRAFT_26707 [Rozella allomycis CSF55]|eukprot:EPZ30986.1 hypothetical protein O9G_001459 [Rozella allomycis CSF55]